jgi:hypothetical protein
MCRGGKRAGLSAVGSRVWRLISWQHCSPIPSERPATHARRHHRSAGASRPESVQTPKGPRSGAEILGISRAAIQRRGPRLLVGSGEGKDSRNFEQPEPKDAGEQTRAEPRTAAQWMAGILPSARCARAYRYRGIRPLEPGTSPAGG